RAVRQRGGPEVRIQDRRDPRAKQGKAVVIFHAAGAVLREMAPGFKRANLAVLATKAGIPPACL
ncbi:MAG: hypothetical protein JWR69_1026, partial [Pedosphaera sp.]|nr:hypothetical protein [Pedosphaera sp.]